MELSAIMKVLGGQRVLGKRIKTRLDLIELSSSGVTKDALAHLANTMCFSMRQMAELLPVAERTIQRYSPEKHFTPYVSEHILQIAEVVARGSEVFEDMDNFLSWMNHPAKALGDTTPASLLKTRFGVEMVLDELARIEHGVFA
jgi:putative toxin-antitoxin system antitoxin component (TIGR02293 family)